MRIIRRTRASILALLVTIIILFFIYLSYSKLTTKLRWFENPVNLRNNYQRNGGGGAEKSTSKRSVPNSDDGMLDKAQQTMRQDHSDSFETDESKANYVREMMLHAWENYKQFAWGQNELSPVSRTAYNPGIFGAEGGASLAATIVDSLDTLWIMGLMQQYEEGRDYVRDHFDIRKINSSVSVFEINIRFLGGLLAAHALTNDPLFREKAKSTGEILLHAFSRHWTPMPTPSIVPSSGEANSRGSVILAEVGSLHMEFLQLSHIIHDSTYLRVVEDIRDRLDHMKKMDGLYANVLLDGGSQTDWAVRLASLGAEGDSFYEYLLKTYVQTNGKDVRAWRMYKEAMKAIEQKMIRVSRGGLTYVGVWNDGVLEKKMGHLACFCAGMFALQSKYELNYRKKLKALKLAEDISNTCHESYIRSASNIGPEMFEFDNPRTEAMATHGDAHYLLRPEVIESFFYLWRLTKKQMYKDWIWNATRAINKYCRVKNGFSGLYDVYHPIYGGHDDVQQSFFLAETLKYAYLTFVDDSVLPLDDWVFNTEAHPLPIIKNLRTQHYRPWQ